MKRLWAPWRLQYIEQTPHEEGCIFCVKPQQARDDENYLLHRGPHCFIMLNAFPYNNGHLLIAPYRHLPDLAELNDDEQLDLLALTNLGMKTLREVYHPQGFNVGINVGQVAGAGIADHIHLHIVPRWSGDTNFMPVLGETRVVPQALSESYERLKKQVRGDRERGEGCPQSRGDRSEDHRHPGRI